MVSFLIYYFPVILLVVSVIGLIWAVLNTRWKYIIPFIVCLGGLWVHYYGMKVVGRWEGMSISLFGGGGLVVLGIGALITVYRLEAAERKRK